jgi:hypothetical protein
MRFQKNLHLLVFFIMPWCSCFAALAEMEPPSSREPALPMIARIASRQDLKETVKTLNSQPHLTNMTIACDSFGWTWWEMFSIFSTFSDFKNVLPKLTDLATVNINILLNTKDVCADGLAPYLISCLKQIPNLKHLTIDGAFTGKSIKYWAGYIKANQQLESLKVNFSLFDENIIELATALEKHPSLTWLALAEGLVDEAGALKLVEVFSTCSRLSHVFLPSVLYWQTSSILWEALLKMERIKYANLGSSHVCEHQKTSRGCCDYCKTY